MVTLAIVAGSRAPEVILWCLKSQLIGNFRHAPHNTQKGPLNNSGPARTSLTITA
jgi:hypothetical protein